MNTQDKFKHTLPLRIRATWLMAFTAGISLSAVSQAAPITWNGSTDTVFGTGSNWVGGNAPQDDLITDIATFGNSLTSNQPSLTAARSVNGISFGTVAWVLGGGTNVLTLGAGGLTLTNSNSATRTISTNIALGADQSWNINNSVSTGGFTNLILNNTLSSSGGPYNLTINGGGRLQVNGSGLLGHSGTLTTNHGSYILLNNSSGSGTNATGATINAGAISPGQPGGSAAFANNATISINAGGLFQIGSGGIGQLNRVNDTASIVFNGGAMVGNRGGSGTTNTETIGAVSFGAGQAAYRVDASNAGASTVSAGASLTRSAGNGTILFSGDNLQIGAAAGGRAQMTFTTAPTDLIGGGGSTTDANAKNNSIIPWAYGDNSTTTTRASASQGNPDGFGKGFVTYDATAGIRLLTNSNYDNDFGTVGNNLRLIANNSATGAQTTNALLVDTNGTAGGNRTVSGDDTLSITSGALMLAGDTSSTSNQTSQGTISGYTGLVFGSTGTPVEGFITVSAIHKNTSSGNFLTPGVLTIASPITHADGITKSGPGTLVLSSGANSYSGDTTISAGTLRLGTGGQLPIGTSLAINGTTAGINNGVASIGNSATNNHQNGVFDLNGQNQTLAGLTGFAGTGGGAVGIVTNSAVGTSLLTHTGTSTFDGIIQDGGAGRQVALTKSTGGNLTLTNINTFSGDTIISGGTLTLSTAGTNNIANTTLIQLTSSGAALDVTTVGGGFVLNGTQTLAGIGTVQGNVSLATGAILDPGLSPGTLTFTGNLDVAAVGNANNGDLRFELGSTSDLIDLTSGVLGIGSNVLGFADFTFTPIAGFGPGIYTLFKTTQTIGDPLDPLDLTGTVGGFDAYLGFAGGGTDLVLTVVPEPSSLAMLAFGAVAMWLFRRRR